MGNIQYIVPRGSKLRFYILGVFLIEVIDTCIVCTCQFSRLFSIVKYASKYAPQQQTIVLLLLLTNKLILAWKKVYG